MKNYTITIETESGEKFVFVTSGRDEIDALSKAVQVFTIMDMDSLKFQDAKHFVK